MATVTFDMATRVFPSATRPAVDRLDLNIEDGEFLVLVGPSGCGKSTSLRMLAGLEFVNGGRIWIGDRDVTRLAPKERDIAMVFQNYALYPHMTVAENMGFALKMANVPKEERNRRVQEAARLLDMEDLLERKPAAMSGGQRQRVAMGRAIVREPKVFLMDEPLSNLDAKLRVSTRTQIAALQARLGITTVYVTHDQVEAMTLADRIVVMDKGVVQQIGTPAELYRTPANLFVAGFIGSPKMNFLAGEWGGAGQVRLKGGASLAVGEPPASVNGGELVLGVRPDGFAVTEPDAASLRGRIVLNEYLGRESYLHLDLEDGNTAVVEVSPDLHLSAGQSVGLTVKPGAAHLFATADQRRLAA